MLGSFTSFSQTLEANIINVSSIFGLIGSPNASDYCASKLAVKGYSEALMVELAHTSCKVHIVHPGCNYQ